MSGILLTLSGVSAVSAPGAPTIGTATATGATTATVAFTAPASDGGSVITSYTATSTPDSITGTLSQAGSGTITVTGLVTNTAYTFTVTATNAIGTSAASAASNSVTPAQVGKLFSFGSASNGQLGQNDAINRSSPTQVGSLTNWKKLSTGLGHCIAVKYDGTLWSWGRNGAGFSSSSGQLGLGDTVARSSPVQVGALTNWSDVFAGGYNSFAITTSGALYAWGYNAYGGLGLGDAHAGFPRNGTSRSSPVQVGAQTGWTSGHSCQTGAGAAIRAGKLYTWGQNNTGQLGNNIGSITTSSPVQVGSNTDWATLGGSSYNVLALTTGGSLYAWGQGYYGSNGDGTTNDRSSPVQVSGTWSSINNNCSWGASFGAKSSGKLYVWGRNDSGNLGLGDTTKRTSPVQLGALTTWSKASGSSNSLGLTTSGALFSWGGNGNGQLGQNNTTSLSSPVQVGSAINFKFVAAGSSSSFVITD